MSVISTGMQFPEIPFITYSGKTTNTHEASAQHRYTMFWVMRFIGCRFCQYDMQKLAEGYQKYVDKDTAVYVVLQSTRESIIELKGEEFEVPYEIVCDIDEVFYKTLDVKATATKEDRMPTSEDGKVKLAAKHEAVAACNFSRKTGEGEAQQLPALFIVDQTNTVRYAHYAVNSIDIPEIDEQLKLLDSLA